MSRWTGDTPARCVPVTPSWSLRNDAGTLQVRRALSTGAGKRFSFSPPKTAKGRSSIKLPEVAKRSLKKHRKAQLEERMKLAGLRKDKGLVFATRLGTPVGRQELVMRSFKPLPRKAGLPNIRFHGLRYTCATVLLGMGVHAKFVQEFLGHATISMTLNTILMSCPAWAMRPRERWTKP